MNKFEKFEALLADPAQAESLFEGSKEDVLAKLEKMGIEFTAQEFDEIIAGMKNAVSDEDGELGEDALETVAGGGAYHRELGRKVGRTVRKLGKVVKWLVDLYNSVAE